MEKKKKKTLKVNKETIAKVSEKDLTDQNGGTCWVSNPRPCTTSNSNVPKDLEISSGVDE